MIGLPLVAAKPPLHLVVPDEQRIRTSGFGLAKHVRDGCFFQLMKNIHYFIISLSRRVKP